MSLAHVSLGKVAAWVVAGAAAVVIMDPTVKVALIVGSTALLSVTITSGTALLMRKWDRADRLREHQELMDGQSVIKHSVDGAAALLQAKYDDASTRADRAEGHREGSDEERAREKP